MSLSKGDNLVIKRGGAILTPDYGEGYHEFEVTEDPKPVFKPEDQEHMYYEVIIKVVK